RCGSAGSISRSSRAAASRTRSRSCRCSCATRACCSAPQAPWRSLALEDDELDAVVDDRRVALAGIEEGLRRAEPAHLEPPLVDAPLDEPVANGLGALIGERLVLVGIVRRLDVDGDAQPQDLAMAAHHRADLTEHVPARVV